MNVGEDLRRSRAGHPEAVPEIAAELGPEIEPPAALVLEPLALRRVLGHFTTGVTVITTMTGEGPVGMTANSFASVSLDPPLILFSVARSSQLTPHLTTADMLAVNILSDSQRHLSAQFARRGFNRFGSTEWARGENGCPLLPGVLAALECRITEVHEGGDHLITVAQVLAIRTGDGIQAPLLFFRGGYHRLS